MIEVRQWEGTTDELASFLQSVWRSAYAGKMPFPLWTQEYLQWQLRLADGANRDCQLAAYDGTRLVGTLLGVRTEFRVDGRVETGLQGSWLSIDAAYQGHGIAPRMAAARLAHERARGGHLIAGFRFVGSRYSRAERPALRQQQRVEKVFLRKLGFWARVLQPRALSRWSLQRAEALLVGLGAPLMGLPQVKSGAMTISKWSPEDAPQGAALLSQEFADLPLSLHWSAQSLAQHCSGPTSQTWVAKDGDLVRGLVNFHTLVFVSRTEAPVAVFDLICLRQLPRTEQQRLLATALRAATEAGAILALKLNSGDVPARPLLSTGFVPRARDSWIVLQWPQAPVQFAPQIPLQVLWR